MIDGITDQEFELSLQRPLSSPEVGLIPPGSKPQPSNQMVGLFGVPSLHPESCHEHQLSGVV